MFDFEGFFVGPETITTGDGQVVQSYLPNDPPSNLKNLHRLDLEEMFSMDSHLYTNMCLMIPMVFTMNGMTMIMFGMKFQLKTQSMVMTKK